MPFHRRFLNRSIEVASVARSSPSGEQTPVARGSPTVNTVPRPGKVRPYESTRLASLFINSRAGICRTWFDLRAFVGLRPQLRRPLIFRRFVAPVLRVSRHLQPIPSYLQPSLFVSGIGSPFRLPPAIICLFPEVHRIVITHGAPMPLGEISTQADN